MDWSKSITERRRDRLLALLLWLGLGHVAAFAAMDPVTNFAVSTLASGIDASTTTLNVASGTGAKYPATALGSYPLVISNCTDYANSALDPNVEIVTATTRAGDTFTVTRGQESTSAVAHNTAGKSYCVELFMTAGMYQRIKDFIVASAASVPGVYDCASQGSCAATVTFIGSAKATLQVSDAQNIASNLSIPGNITVRRVGAGKLQIPDGVTLTGVSPEQFDADIRTQLFEFTGTGTGLVAFTSPGTVPITWCGAIAGDGTDDSVAAIKCHASLPGSTASSILEIPPGSYTWNSELDSSTDNLMIRMPGAILDLTGMAGTGHSNIHGVGNVLAAIRLTGNRQRVVGGRITGPSLVQTTIRTTGVLLDGATNTRVSSVLIDGLYACIWAGGNTTDLTIANVEANACGYGIYLGFAGGTMSNPQVTRATLQNVRAHHSTIGDGVILDSHSRDISILGGYFYSNATNGIFGEFSGERIQIIGVNTSNNSGRGIRLRYGSNTGDTAGKWGYARRAIIADNILKDNTLDNLSIQLDDYSAFSAIGGVEEVTIANNYSEGSGDHGYVINCVRCIIQGNQAQRNQEYGFVFRSLQDASIHGNQSWNNGTVGANGRGYQFTTAATTGSTPPDSQRVGFIGNLGGDTRTAGDRTTNFVFDTSKLANSTVSGNIGTNANTADWVSVNGLTSVAFFQNRGTVSGSDVIGAPVAKHLSATATYDPPSVASGSQTSTTITVPGAAVGDTATCGHTTITADLWQMACYVSAADTVRVVLKNHSGGAIDAASGTLRADVWKH